MFKNYLVAALRSMARQRLFSAINILGLAIGLAACILILLFIRDEVSYDGWLPGAENIYRVEMMANIPGRDRFVTSQSMPPLKDAFLTDFPEAQTATRLFYDPVGVTAGDRSFLDSFMFADATLFEVFDVPFLEGNAATALADPNSVVLSETMARKYFGQGSPLGKTLTIVYDVARDYRVTAVTKDLPNNTHFILDAVIRINPADFLTDEGQNQLERWGSISFYTYIRFRQGTDLTAVGERLNPFMDRHFPTSITDRMNMTGSELFAPKLVNTRDIHLYGGERGTIKPRGSVATLIAFGSIAGLILAVACINFINLSTARASRRAKEVAIRKIVGASRRELFVQFQSEAFLITGFATLLALALVELALPWYNEFSQKLMAAQFAGDPVVQVGLLGLLVVVGMGAGAHPALVLSAFRPTRILGATTSGGDGSKNLRTVLVVIQFAISIGLLIATSVIYAQTTYARNFEPGFIRQNMLVLYGIRRNEVKPVADTLVEQLRRHPDVLSVTRSGVVPGDSGWVHFSVRRPGEPDNQSIVMSQLAVDFDFFKTYGISLIAGRSFDPARSVDIFQEDDGSPQKSAASAVINMAGVKRLGFASPEDALGQVVITVGANQTDLTIIGVVHNAHFELARNTAPATVYIVERDDTGPITVRFKSSDLPGFLADIDRMWNDLVPQIPISRVSLDQNLTALFAADESRGQMLAIFAGLAVLVGSLGLFGLSAFTVERRTREISMRKVMGASVSNIVGLLVWQFSKPVLIANLIAWPVAFYFMRDWLDGFAFTIELGPRYFVGAGLAALFVAWVTTAGHALRVARSSPIEALRYE